MEINNPVEAIPPVEYPAPASVVPESKETRTETATPPVVQSDTHDDGLGTVVDVLA
jgi:hypothetical protein